MRTPPPFTIRQLDHVVLRKDKLGRPHGTRLSQSRLRSAELLGASVA